MFPIRAEITEGTYVVFKYNTPVFIIEKTYDELNIYSTAEDCKCFLETISSDPDEFMGIDMWRDNYIELYKHDEHSVYMMEH